MLLSYPFLVYNSKYYVAPQVAASSRSDEIESAKKGTSGDRLYLAHIVLIVFEVTLHF